ncbi:MAG: CoA pyrophosphatase [Anaerolineales bacterium]|nr:CoA pyrophosphatase [Anaerolineales bacterium]
MENPLHGNNTEHYPPPAPGVKLSAVLILLRHRKDVWEVFFTRRSEQLADHRGQIAFPGGRAEPGDSGPLQTALREACEEVGIAPGAVQPAGILDPVDTSTGFRVWPVVGVLRLSANPRPSSPEVAEVFWIPLDWLAAEGRWEWRMVSAGENHNSEREDASHLIASEAPPAHPPPGQAKQSPVFDGNGEMAPTPEPALSGAKEPPAMPFSFSPRPDGERKTIFFQPYHGRILWGATAMITIQLLDRLRTGGSG